MDRYFLSVTLAGEKIEREVSVEEFCRAERQAGFYPKGAANAPRFMTTPATGGFGSTASGISGRIESTRPTRDVEMLPGCDCHACGRGHLVPRVPNYPSTQCDHCGARVGPDAPPSDGASMTYSKWTHSYGVRNALAIAAIASICLSAVVVAVTIIKW